jgi:folylpolyglutamate synthase/dihydropteroate synthase
VPQPLHLVVAMVNRKDPKALLELLLPYVESITVTQIEGEATSFTSDQLYELIEPLGVKHLYKAETMEEALTLIKAYHVTPNARVLMIGSLYFMGNILSKCG